MSEQARTEALVQQIAEAIGESLDTEEPSWGINDRAHEALTRAATAAVLPLVEAQVAPLRDELDRLREANAGLRELEARSFVAAEKSDAVMREASERRYAAESALLRVRALADSFADDERARYGGNIAWHIEEAIANEKGDCPDAADLRIASQRERADAAESALRQVREDLTALADAVGQVAQELIDRAGRTSHLPSKSTYLTVSRQLDTALARVGAADTQPEGASEVDHRKLRVTGIVHHPPRPTAPTQPEAGDIFEFRNGISTRPAPTAGGKVDTAPEAGEWVAEETKYGTIHRCRHCKGVNDWTGHQTDCPVYRAAVARSQAARGIEPADTAPESGEGR